MADSRQPPAFCPRPSSSPAGRGDGVARHGRRYADSPTTPNRTRGQQPGIMRGPQRPRCAGCKRLSLPYPSTVRVESRHQHGFSRCDGFPPDPTRSILGCASDGLKRTVSGHLRTLTDARHGVENGDSISQWPPGQCVALGRALERSWPGSCSHVAATPADGWRTETWSPCHRQRLRE